MYIVKFLKIIKKIFSSKLIFKNPEPKVFFFGVDQDIQQHFKKKMNSLILKI